MPWPQCGHGEDSASIPWPWRVEEGCNFICGYLAGTHRVPVGYLACTQSVVSVQFPCSFSWRVPDVVSGAAGEKFLRAPFLACSSRGVPVYFADTLRYTPVHLKIARKLA